MELTEIKKGKTGTGLLIENDGHISLNEGKNKTLKESFENSEEWEVPYPFVVDAVLQKCDIKNANGRIYPSSVLKREVQKYQEKISDKSALGECNHPSETSIDLGRVSHNIIEVHWEGRTVVGKLELNLTYGYRKQGIVSSYGDTIANLLLNGYKIGISSRGVGDVEQKGEEYIVTDYELICWDIVSDPSTPGAYLSTSGIEDLGQYFEGKKKNGTPLIEKLNKLEKLI